MSNSATAKPAEPADAADPFDTAGLRRRVLSAWAASPQRFREDANAEEDLALGGYRDRLLVELAQNASDAALRTGGGGTLRLTVSGGVLRAANTGAPLDREGVVSLASLRASSKRAAAAGGTVATVGRFGVGFAAVLAASAEPSVVSTTGGVRFSEAATREEVARVAALGPELAARDGAVPVLRLPWPDGGAPPEGFDTEVRLPLRPGVQDAVRAALDALPADLLLALPGLARVEAGSRVLSRVDGGDHVLLGEDGRTRRWRVSRADGHVPPELLADRPTEERGRDVWSVCWAVPVGAAGEPEPLPAGQVVHAPTPSAEPLSLPARLVATFPLDPDRRHVAAGPLTRLIAERAGAAYAALVAALPPTPALLALVPRPGVAAAELDATLSRHALDALREAAWLPAGPGEPAGPNGQGRLRPAEAVVVDAAGTDLVEALRDAVGGLLPAPWSGRAAAAALNAVSVRRLSTRDVVELVSGITRDPPWWRRLYRALVDAEDRDALAGLPVPLADGRTVRGPRGLLLPAAGTAPASARVLGLRIVHPDAADPALERLGAVPTTPAALLADERVRAAVESSLDEEDPEPVAAAVLDLVEAAAPGRPGRPGRPGDPHGGAPRWLAELALPADDGGFAPAGELMLPGSALAGLVDPDGPLRPVRADLPDRWSAATLTAVGVLDSFAVLRVPDVGLDEPDHDLDGQDGYYDALLDRLPDGDLPPKLVELAAVRDLELVRPDRWPQALALLAGPRLRPVVERPAVAVLPGGREVPVPSYTRWWLATHPVCGGRVPVELRLPGARELAGLYDEAVGDADLLVLAGCLGGLDDVLADPGLAEDLLGRLGDPRRRAPAELLRDCYARLAEVLDGFAVPPPPAVRVAPETVVARSSAVVLDAPYLAPVLDGLVPVPAGGRPHPVADLLDVPLATEVVAGARVRTRPDRTTQWAEVAGVDLAAQRCGSAPPAPPASVAWHDGLRVGATAVGWWPDGDVDHVDVAAGPEALGRALAWRLGRWDRRAALAEAFAATADPRRTARLRAEDAAE